MRNKKVVGARSSTMDSCALNAPRDVACLRAAASASSALLPLPTSLHSFSLLVPTPQHTGSRASSSSPSSSAAESDGDGGGGEDGSAGRRGGGSAGRHRAVDARAGLHPALRARADRGCPAMLDLEPLHGRRRPRLWLWRLRRGAGQPRLRDNRHVTALLVWWRDGWVARGGDGGNSECDNGGIERW